MIRTPRTSRNEARPAPPGMRALSVAVGIVVVLGLGVAAASLIGFDAVIAAGQAADPTATRDSLVSAVITRAAVAGLLAIVWPLLLRRLARGRTRVYARIRRVSVIAAVALVVVAVTGAAPGWLHLLQGLQVLGLLGVFAVTLRRDLRAWYAENRDDPELAGTWKPVLLLVLLAPLIAEVTIGDLPFSGTGLIAAAFTLPIYGAGALLVREVVRRTGRGWPSILLLGLAYALVEEGLALQSFFDPTIYGGIGPAWGARVLGVNGTYVVVQLVNHAVWSVAVPILLTEAVFPGRRDRPFLRRPGLIVTILAYLLGVGLVALSARLQLSPGYTAPLPLLVATVVLVVVLAVVALRILPARTTGPRHPEPRYTGPPAPRPWLVAVAGFLAAFVFLAVLVLPGDAHLALMRGIGVVGPLVVALGVVAAMVVLVRRWAAAPDWGDRHAIALAGGALLGHSLLWGLTQPHTWPDRAAVGVLFVLTALALVLLARVRPGGGLPSSRPEG